MNWGNEWWADSYNNALGGKKKKKKKKEKKASDGSDSDPMASDSDSDASTDSDDADGDTAGVAILSQQDHLVQMGLSNARADTSTAGKGFVTASLAEEMTEKKTKKQRSGKEQIESAGGRVCAKHGFTAVGKQARIAAAEAALAQSGYKMGGDEMKQMMGALRRSPKLKASAAAAARASQQLMMDFELDKDDTKKSKKEKKSKKKKKEASSEEEEEESPKKEKKSKKSKKEKKLEEEEEEEEESPKKKKKAKKEKKAKK